MNQQSVANFKDQNRALQELVREIKILRAHNLRIREGDPQDKLWMFAEAALTCLALEHFVRIVVENYVRDATLHNLLQVAVSRNLLKLPYDDQQAGIKEVCDVRNTLLHANTHKLRPQLNVQALRTTSRPSSPVRSKRCFGSPTTS